LAVHPVAEVHNVGVMARAHTTRDPEHITTADGRAGAHDDAAEVGVRRPARAAMLERDRAGTADSPGEGDQTVVGRPDGTPGCAREIDPEMSGPERVLRLFVAPDNRAIDRWPPPAGRPFLQVGRTRGG
jgi:hypothetical protein